MGESTMSRLLCLLGLHTWEFKFFTAGWFVYRCARCGAEWGRR